MQTRLLADFTVLHKTALQLGATEVFLAPQDDRHAQVLPIHPVTSPNR